MRGGSGSRRFGKGQITMALTVGIPPLPGQAFSVFLPPVFNGPAALNGAGQGSPPDGAAPLQSLDATRPAVVSGVPGAPGAPDQAAGPSFSDVLRSALREVNDLQTKSDELTQKLALGDADIHTVMIAAQKAELALRLTISVRNKVLEAYQEIMRMPL